MKRIKKIIIAITIIVFILIIFLIMIFNSLFISSNSIGESSTYKIATKEGLPAEVEKHRATVETIAKKYGIEDYVDLILCIINQESGGTAKDVMQSSESRGDPPNTIQDQTESIDVGIKYLKQCFDTAKKEGVTDIYSIVQSYNYGTGFLNYVKNENNGIWTEEVSKKFSNAQIEKRKKKNNENKNDTYGDPTYAEKVLSKLEVVENSYKVSYSALGTEKFEALMKEALKYENDPYWWSGDNPSEGFDCSGLVQYCYKTIGINLPRTAQTQYEACTLISEDELLPGDLVFFTGTYKTENYITHVAIYCGNNTTYESAGSGIGYKQNLDKRGAVAYGRVPN